MVPDVPQGAQPPSPTLFNFAAPPPPSFAQLYAMLNPEPGPSSSIVAPLPPVPVVRPSRPAAATRHPPPGHPEGSGTFNFPFAPRDQLVGGSSSDMPWIQVPLLPNDQAQVVPPPPPYSRHSNDENARKVTFLVSTPFGDMVTLSAKRSVRVSKALEAACNIFKLRVRTIAMPLLRVRVLTNARHLIHSLPSVVSTMRAGCMEAMRWKGSRCSRSTLVGRRCLSAKATSRTPG